MVTMLRSVCFEVRATIATLCMRSGKIYKVNVYYFVLVSWLIISVSS